MVFWILIAIMTAANVYEWVAARRRRAAVPKVYPCSPALFRVRPQISNRYDVH